MRTRDRLLREGLRLFAEQGYDGTTVGEIEQAAGLQPRRGALYRHFTSKQALLEAATAEYGGSLDRAIADYNKNSAVDAYTLADRFTEWFLAEIDAQRTLMHVVEREGSRVKSTRDAFRKSSDVGFRSAAGTIRAYLADTSVDPDTVDAEAIGIILLGGVINARRSAWTFGRAPLGISDERVAAAFAWLFERATSEPPADVPARPRPVKRQRPPRR